MGQGKAIIVSWMSRRNTPLDFNNPLFKQDLRINPLKVLAYQKPKQPSDLESRPVRKSEVPIHKNISKPVAAKEQKPLRKTKMCPMGRDCRSKLTCRFAHHQKELPRRFFKRTKPCLLYQRGMCSLGSSCREYHGNFDLKNWNDKNYKKELCEDFTKGDCSLGKLCVKAHGEEELEQYARGEEELQELEEVHSQEDQEKQKPIVIALSTYKPNSYTMSLVTQDKLVDRIQVGESLDVFKGSES